MEVNLLNNKIVVVGAGYVGLATAVLFSQIYSVTILEIDYEKIEKINKRKSPLKDETIESFFADKTLDLTATNDEKSAYSNADLIIICIPTDYNEQLKSFDTTKIGYVIEKALKYNKNADIVIKSTLPIGYTSDIIQTSGYSDIIYSPEFLREGHALSDMMTPDRVIIGSCDCNRECAHRYLEKLQKCIHCDTDVQIMGNSEAEAVKLFSNAYLAMRVSFFNELDMFAENNNMSSFQIIKGVCKDTRIGDYYNNPSFGFGGYCLPKDVKQLIADFKELPCTLIKSVSDSNQIRFLVMAQNILEKAVKLSVNPTIGVYRLSMKSGSDNFRQSSVLNVIEQECLKGIRIIIYEPEIHQKKYIDYEVLGDLTEFKKESTIIIANRKDSLLDDVSNKIYSRDVFGKN